MSDPTPNQFNTATITGLVVAWLAVLAPFIQGGMVWIQAHSAIVFGEGYLEVLRSAIEGTVIVAVVYWHTRKP